MSRKKGKCEECGKQGELHAREMCNTCYRRWQYNHRENWDIDKLKARLKKEDSKSERKEAHRLRRKAQFRHNNEGYCVKCLIYGKHHRHHKDGNLTNWSKENIKLLCQKCHSLEHRNMVLKG